MSSLPCTSCKFDSKPVVPKSAKSSAKPKETKVLTVRTPDRSSLTKDRKSVSKETVPADQADAPKPEATSNAADEQALVPADAPYAADDLTSQSFGSYEYYCLGGFDGAKFDVDDAREVFKLNHRTKTWEPQEHMPHPRVHHAAVTFDGNIYVIGGGLAADCYTPKSDQSVTVSPTATLSKFTPATNKWEDMKPMKTKRMYHCAVACFGIIIVFGGQDERQKYVMFDLISLRILGNMLADGSLLETVEIYDIEHNQWTMGSSLRQPLLGAAAAVVGGQVYVSGGVTQPLIVGEKFNISRKIYAYDPYNNDWSDLPSMPVGVAHHVMAVFHGEVFVIGGAISGTKQPNKSDLEVTTPIPHFVAKQEVFTLNQEIQKWEPAGKLKSPRYSFAAAYTGSEVVITGGRGARAEEILDTTEKFDVYNRRSMVGTTLPRRRVAFQLVALPLPPQQNTQRQL